MSEDALRSWRELKKKREKQYTEVKGIIKGIQLAEPSELIKAFMTVFDSMTDGFKSVSDGIAALYENQFQAAQEINNLKKEVKKLKESVNQLRATLDKLYEMK